MLRKAVPILQGYEDEFLKLTSTKIKDRDKIKNRM